jgi:hypothetical protein
MGAGGHLLEVAGVDALPVDVDAACELDRGGEQAGGDKLAAPRPRCARPARSRERAQPLDLLIGRFHAQPQPCHRRGLDDRLRVGVANEPPVADGRSNQPATAARVPVR